MHYSLGGEGVVNLRTVTCANRADAYVLICTCIYMYMCMYLSSSSLLICVHAFQGKTEKKSFTDWKVKSIPTEVLAREHLRRHGVEHYWDLALSETIVEQGQDD